ncbi:Ig-like domain-containing protein [Hyalangium versicolor]|uniref:Ig-like domain-containing protein n=1 Tax=Hyalangium versicolor TaxID=2861190 RepID=UPI001CC95652|nr:Ig-like domain-containing protein [Hyalangium versicolor]
MSTRLSLALLLLAFTGCIDGSTPVNVGATRGEPDATHSTVEVVPDTGVAADGVSVALVKVTVRDRNDRVLSGVAVSFTATGSGNTLTQPPVTDSSGLTQGSIASTRAETKTLTVVVGSGDRTVELTQHPDVTFVAGDASRLEFVTQPPGSVRAGEVFAPAVHLRVLDAQGNVVTAPVDVTLTLEPAASGATLGGTATRATLEGEASFDDLAVTRAGVGYTLVASGPGLVSATSTPFDVTAGPADPTKTLVEVSKSGVVADGTDFTVITVTVRDAFDNPVPSQAVDISSTGSDNTLTPSGSTSGADGTVTATLSSTTAEVKTIQATVNGVVAPPTPQVTFTSGTADQLVFVVQPPVQTVAGQTMAPAVEVQALDAQGNRVNSASFNVTLELEPTTSGATLGGTVTKALVSGAVSFGDLNVKKAGAGYTLRATASGVTEALSNSFTIVAGPVDLTRTLVQVSKGTVTADDSDFTTITVTSRDAFDNPVSGQAVGLSVSGTSNTLSADNGTSGSDGTFSATLKSTKAELKTVSATLNGSAVSPQPQVNFVSATASRLSFVVQPPTQTVAGQTLAPAVQVEVLDPQGNRVTSANANVTLVLEPVASGATLGGTTTKTLVSGLVDFSDLNVQKAGTGYTLRATATGLFDAVSTVFDVSAGPVDLSRTLVEVSKATVTADGTDSTTIKVTSRDSFDNAVSNQAVGLTVSGTSNTLSAASGNTGSDGTFSSTLKSTKAEVKTVSATLNGTAVSPQPQVTFVSGSGSRLAFVVHPPAQTVAGQAMTPEVQVEVLDAQGNRVTSTSANVTLKLEPVASGATLGGTTTKALAAGLVSFSDLNVQKAGTGYTLRATSVGLTDAVSTAFDITAGPVDLTRTLVQVSKTTVTADGADFTTITVTSRDSFDNPVSNQAVGLTVSGTLNTLSVASGNTGTNGTFSATLKSSKAEVKTITATVNGTAVSPQPQVTFVSGSGSRLSFVVQPPTQTVAGQTLAPAVQVEVLDAQGNRVTSASANVTLTLGPVASGATLGGTTTKALASGLVSFSDLNVQKAGTGYTLRATAAGLTDAVSTAFDITAGPVDLTRTLVQVSKTTVTADGADFTTITVTSRDSFDNPVSGQTVGLAVSGTFNTLAPTTGTTGTNGTFTATLKSTKAESKTVSATLNSSPVSSQPQVTFVSGTATRLAFVVQPPTSTGAGQTMTPAVQVEALDAQGNRVASASANVTLTLEPVASGATLGGTTTKALAAGLVSFSDLNVQKAGTGYTLRATASGLTDAVSTLFNITAGTVDLTRTLVQVSKTTVTADGADFTTITVTSRDSFDNPVSNQAVGLTVSGTGNTLSVASGNTVADGTFSATLKSIKAEVKTIAATLNGTAVSPQPQVTFVAGTASKLSFVVHPPSQTVAGQTLAPAVQVEVLDVQGNRVTSASANITLTLEPVASGATLGGTTTKALAAGLVSFSDLNVQKAGTNYTLRATSAGLTDAVSTAFAITAGTVDLTRTLVQVSKTTVTADGADFTTITVTSRDSFDNPVSNQAVGLTVSGTNNTLSAASGSTDTNGTFSATLKSTKAESKTVSATVNGTAVSPQPQVTFVAGTATQLAFVVQPPTQTVAGQTLAPAVQVEARDAQGNRVTSASANVALTLEPVASGATLGGTTTKALAAGLASFGDLNVQKAGTNYTLRATSAGLTDAVSTAFDITAGTVDLTRTLVQVSKTTVTADGTDSTTITVTSRDSFDNPVSGQTVGLAVSGTSNTLSAASGTTGTNGTFTATLKSIKAEVKTVSATLNSSPVSSQPQVTFVAGPATRLAFVVQPPTSTGAGQTMTPAVQVEALDAQGNRVTSSTLSVTLAIEPVASGATLGGTTTKALASGVASFSDLKVQKTGTGYTLRATATGLTDAVSSLFNITAGPVDLSRTLVEVSKATVTADGTDSTTITVTSRDSFDNPVSGQAVALTASGTNNTLVPTSGTTGTNGTFTATLKSIKAEVKTVSATVNGTAATAQPQVTFVPGPAAKLAFVVQPPAQTGAGQTMTPAVQVEVLDAQGNRVTSSTLSVMLALEPAASGATLSGTTTKAVVSGLVSFSDLSVRKAGTAYTLRATATGLTDAVSTPFNIVAGSVDLTRTLVEISKNTVTADNTDFTTVTVTVRDAFDNPVSAQAVAFTVTGSGNTLSAASGSTGTNGIFSATLKSTKAEAKTISATVNGTAVSPQPQVTFVPGPAVKLAFVTQPPTQTVAGQVLAPAIDVEALDAQGNRVSSPNVSVTLVLEPTSSGATLGGTGTRITASGVASFGDLFIQKAGTGYTLRATAPGLTSAVSNPFNIVADVPSLPQTTVTLSKSTVAADNLDFTTITVTVRDAFGNPVSGQAVSLAVTGSDNILSSTSGPTAADGTFSATLKSIMAEIKTVSATLNGNPIAQQPQVTFIPGPPVSLRFHTEPPLAVGAGQTMVPSVQVEVLDAQGNRATGSTATIALAVEPTSSGATLGGTVSRAAVAGMATFDDLFVRQAGTGYSLRATSVGLSDGVSGLFSVIAGTPSLLTSTLTVAPASLAADNVAEATITVTVKDSYGNPVSNQSVVLAVSGVNNTLTASSGTSGTDGKFVAKLRSTTAEVKNVDATAASLTLPTATVTFVAGPVSTLNLVAVPTQLEANGTDKTTLTATVEDSFGNRVPNVAITFTATGSGNIFNPGDGNTDVNGQRIAGLSSTVTGVKTVTATGAGKTGIATVTFLRPPAQVINPVLVGSTASSCATLQYTLTQAASSRADVIVEYEDNGVFKRATQAGSSTGSGVQGVATSPTGVTHTFLWNSTADLPSSTATIRMRITAQVQGALPSSGYINGVVMANGMQFAAPGLVPAGTAPGLVARADLNNDGKTDIVVGSATSNDLQVLLGDGAGSFAAATPVTVGFPSSALVVWDVDGDGKMDVLTGGASNSNVYLLKGTGTGTFSAATVATTLQGPAAGLVVGDFNRDGKVDLIATSTAGTVEVALATTAGVFGAPTRTTVGGSPQAIATADLNLDARLDLIFVDPTQDVKVMLGTGSGTFGAVTPLGMGAGVTAHSVADLNKDARPDVVAALGASGTVRVARGNGDGTFSLQTAITTGGQPAGLAVVDMDEDSNRDVVVTGVGSDVLILSGKSDGSLNTTPRVTPAGGPATSVVVLDADRSGRQDIVAVRPASNGVAVLLSMQADRCEAALNAGLHLQVSPSPAASTVADLDGDGRPDLVVAVGGTTAGASALAVAKGRGNGSFSAFTTVSLGTTALNPQGVTTGDFNGDGRLDLVSANQSANTVSVLLDNGAGGYGTPATWNTGAGPKGMATADFDLDGKLDLVVANSTGSNVTVLYGNGDGTFPTSFNFNVGVSPQSLVVVDLNGDGKPDIATANFGGSSVTALRNNGGRSSTAFTSMGNTVAGYAPRAISAGDFNGDNKPDIVVVGNPSSVGAVSVMLGAGDGTLGSAATTSANPGTPEFKDPRGVVVGDFDQDGKLDVIAGNNTDVSVILLKGLGTGRFTIGSSTATGTGIVDMVGSDVDGDGLPDLVGTLTADNRVFVLRSKGIGLPGPTAYPLQSVSGAVTGRGVTVVDLNKDGKPDVLTTNRSTNKLSLLFGDGTGNFLLSSTAPAVGTAPSFATTGDIDRDGNTDVVVTNNNSSTPSISVLLGDGNGGLTKLATDLTYPVAPRSPLLVDFNSDGAPDLLACGNAVYLRLNTGGGTFANYTTNTVGGAPQSEVVADFNLDGRPDVAVTNNASSAAVGVLLGNGAGGFVTPAKTQGLSGAGVALATADFDRDGKPDLAVTVTASTGVYDVKVIKGRGDGTFDSTVWATLSFSAPSVAPEWIQATDFDGDGRADIAVSAPGVDAVIIWRGNGAGGFSAPSIWGSTDQAQAATLADVNGDGLVDVVNGGFSLLGVLPGR